MKKLLISLIVFFSSFLLLNKINAQSNYDVIFDYSSSKFQVLDNNYSLIEDIISYINDHNIRNFGTFLSYKYVSDNDIRIYFGVTQKTLQNSSYFRDMLYLRLYSNVYRFDSGNVGLINASSCYFGQTNCNYNTYINLLNYTQNDLQTFYNNINNLLTSSQSTNTSLTPVANTNLSSVPYSPYDTSNFLAYVWSNKPLYYFLGPNVSGTNYLTGIEIDNNIYSPSTSSTLTDELLNYKTWYDLQPHGPSITFTSQNYTSNNDVYKKDVTIDFGVIDNDNYYYMYLDTNENIWHNLYLTNSTSYTLSIYDNTNIIAQIINKSDNTIYSNASFLVNDITSDLKINIENIPVRNENENNILFYQTNIKYFSDNRNNYIYDYTTSNYYVNNDYEYITIDNNSSEVTFRNYNNLVIIARIKDLQGNILYTKTAEINSLISKPIITFTELDNLSVSDIWYNSYVSSVILNINYGYIDTSRYIYLYKKDNEENWTTFNPLNFNDKSINLNIDENTNIIARVLNKSDNTIFTQSSYTIYKISSPDENSSFLGPLKNIFKQAQWKTIISYFTNVFNTIIDTKLFPYIVLIIITSIFLMLMNSLK